jgi:hypothetical protein
MFHRRWNSKFRTLDPWKIVTAPCYFQYQSRDGSEKALRALREIFHAKGATFTQRAQRLILLCPLDMAVKYNNATFLVRRRLRVLKLEVKKGI